MAFPGCRRGQLSGGEKLLSLVTSKQSFNIMNRTVRLVNAGLDIAGRALKRPRNRYTSAWRCYRALTHDLYMLPEHRGRAAPQGRASYCATS